MSEPRLPVYEFHNFRVDVAKRLIYGETGGTLPLSPKVFDTLLYLIENRRKVVEKDELMKAIWNDTVVEENNLNKNISILRRALGEKPGEHRFIVTVPGHGYRFVPEVKVIENDGIASRIDVRSPENLRDESSAPPRSSRKHYAAVLIGILAVASALAAFYWWRHSRIAVSDEKVESIAVLPFMPLVAENRNEALELGMADALITKLAESRQIVVRPFGSVRRYASLEQDALAAGRALRTDAVLSGTIQNAGERLRVSARLVRVSDGKQIWAGRFDEKLTDVFAVQDSISQRVANVLKIRFETPERKGATENLEAYQLYMKGRFHVYKGRRAEIETGISYFLKAIEIDPD